MRQHSQQRPLPLAGPDGVIRRQRGPIWTVRWPRRSLGHGLVQCAGWAAYRTEAELLAAELLAAHETG